MEGERRAHHRYPVELDLEYKIVKGGTVIAAGNGKIHNMSSGGILFDGLEEVETGACLELSIHWPALSGTAPFMQLWGFGHVMRSGPTGTAVRMSRYQFQRIDDVKTPFDRLAPALVQ